MESITIPGRISPTTQELSTAVHALRRTLDVDPTTTIYPRGYTGGLGLPLITYWYQAAMRYVYYDI